MTYLHTNQLLRGPIEGKYGRANFVGTASCSDLPSHAISLGRPIVIGFACKRFYVGLGMVQCVLLQTHLGMIPLIVLVPDAAALAWNRPRRGQLRHTEIYHLRRPSKPYPVAPFGDWRLPLRPLPSNRNWHSQPAPWSKSSQFREYRLNSEGEDQGGKTHAVGHRRESHYQM